MKNIGELQIIIECPNTIFHLYIDSEDELSKVKVFMNNIKHVDSISLHKEEGLIQMLADFKSVVKQAGSDYNPSIIANYAYDLVKEYNQFYHDFSILREENEALKVFRLALSANVGKIVKTAMGLLGIEVPERM